MNIFLQLILIFILILGLWIGRKFLPSLAFWLEQIPNRPLSLTPTSKFLLWLATGSLFTGAFLSIFGMFFPLVMVLFNPDWCTRQPRFVTMFGNIGGCFYVIPSILLFMIVFSIVFWLGRSFFKRETKRQNKFYVVLILLTISNLIYQLFFSLLSQISAI